MSLLGSNKNLLLLKEIAESPDRTKKGPGETRERITRAKRCDSAGHIPGHPTENIVNNKLFTNSFFSP
jgi:hypothetical protein